MFTSSSNIYLDMIRYDQIDIFNSLIISNENVYNAINQIDLICRRKHSTLIHLCAQHNSIKLGEFLLNYDQKYCNHKDFEGRTPLHVACIYRSNEFAQILIKNGCELDTLKKGDWTPLMITIAKENIILVELLLKNGADITQCNRDGRTIFHIASSIGNVHLFRTLYDYANECGLEYLLFVKSKNGRNLMHTACIHRQIDLVKYILTLDKLIDKLIDEKDNCDVTPFMDAARMDCVIICQMIAESLKDKLNVNQIDRTGRTSLHMAAQANALNTIKYLVINLQCSLDHLDSWGQSSIYLSIQEGHVEATKLLIDLNANYKLKDFNGRSPLDIAQLYGHVQLGEYLKSLYSNEPIR